MPLAMIGSRVVEVRHWARRIEMRSNTSEGGAALVRRRIRRMGGQAPNNRFPLTPVDPGCYQLWWYFRRVRTDPATPRLVVYSTDRKPVVNRFVGFSADRMSRLGYPVLIAGGNYGRTGRPERKKIRRIGLPQARIYRKGNNPDAADAPPVDFQPGQFSAPHGF